MSFADFLFRLAFFLLAPGAIVVVAELFPVRGALIDVGLALAVFVTSEALRGPVQKWKPLSWLLSEALHFEAHYRARAPRPFAYYVFYPLLFPYWLFVPDARREFLVFRSYTAGSFVLLLGSLAYQYFSQWAPELGLRAFLPFVLLALAVETVLVLALLMPIATTVVWYHGSFRRKRLLWVLLAGFLSTALSLAYVSRRRDPIVSYATRERVRLRTAAAPKPAHRALRQAVSAALAEALKSPEVEGDGGVSGPALDRARERLAQFYKNDEAYAFELWASPRKRPRVLVLYFEARPHKPPIWVAISRSGAEIRAASELPAGAFRAMRRAAGTGAEDAALWTWPDELNFDDEEPSRTRSRRGTPRGPAGRASASASASAEAASASAASAPSAASSHETGPPSPEPALAPAPNGGAASPPSASP